MGRSLDKLVALLRTEGIREYVMHESRMITLTEPASFNQSNEMEHIEALIRSCGEHPPPAGPPRLLAARLPEGAWVVLRTDGWAATPGGPFDIADRWRRGDDVETIAASIHTLATG